MNMELLVSVIFHLALALAFAETAERLIYEKISKDVFVASILALTLMFAAFNFDARTKERHATQIEEMRAQIEEMSAQIEEVKVRICEASEE